MAVIFVYGTLKRGGENHRHLEGQVFIGEARTEPAYKMYRLDGYPGMVESRDGTAVTGELWEVDELALRRIDVLEGTSVGLYARRPVRLQPPHAAAGAETYFYLRPTEGCEELGATFPISDSKLDPHDILGAHRHRARLPTGDQIAIDPAAEAEPPAPMD